MPGALGGVLRMLEGGGDCAGAVTPLAAVSRALDKARWAKIASGLRQCLVFQDAGSLTSRAGEAFPLTGLVRRRQPDRNVGCVRDRVVHSAVRCLGQEARASVRREVGREADLHVDRSDSSGLDAHVEASSHLEAGRVKVMPAEVSASVRSPRTRRDPRRRARSGGADVAAADLSRLVDSDRWTADPNVEAVVGLPPHVHRLDLRGRPGYRGTAAVTAAGTAAGDPPRRNQRRYSRSPGDRVVARARWSARPGSRERGWPSSAARGRRGR